MIDLTPKMHIPTAETELALPFATTSMAQSTGGLSTFANAIKRGAGNKIYGLDDNGQWMGAADFANAPFSVDYQGHLHATDAEISGYSKLTIFKQDAIPVSIAVGDLWFDTNDSNKLYRAGSVGADQVQAGEWELVRDSQIATALTNASNAASDAADAQSTADSKINVFAQDNPPTSLAIGDLWYDTNDNNKPYRAASIGADTITAGEWVAVEDMRAADALLKAGASQVLSGDIQVGSALIKIDGANGRIVGSDGTNNRFVLGNV
jgi:hypothetical protein